MNSSIIKTSTYKKISLVNKIRLGIRNTFNIKVKFLLLLFMYVFTVFAISINYASNKEDEYLLKKNGINNYLFDTNDKKIILEKKDKTVFTDEDFNKISKLDNIDKINKDDILLDSYIDLVDAKMDIYLNGNVKDITTFNDKLTYGRTPENENEIIAVSSSYDYYFANQYEEVLDRSFYLSDGFSPSKRKEYKIVGIVLSNNENTTFYVSNSITDNFLEEVISRNSKTMVKFNDTFIKTEYYDLDKRVLPSSKVKDGEVHVSVNHNDLCKNYNCNNKTISIKVENTFYEDTIDLKVKKVYNKYSFKRSSDNDSYNTYGNSIFISYNDYKRLYNKGLYQSSVEVKNIDKIDNTVKSLNALNYKTFVIKDHLVVMEPLQYLQIFMTIISLILIAVLFVITYFVTKVILKSRKTYFSTIRMLGSTKKDCKNLLTIELLTITNLSFLIFITSLMLFKLGYINISLLETVTKYTGIIEYLFIYLIINIMSYIISLKYAKKIFKNTAISTLREDD